VRPVLFKKPGAPHSHRETRLNVSYCAQKCEPSSVMLYSPEFVCRRPWRMLGIRKALEPGSGTAVFQEKESR
jgi:hypothetical protein